MKYTCYLQQHLMLLKTLEEPPKHAIFILATTENIKLFQRYYLVAKYFLKESL
jgi:hypothetical protein